MFLRIGSAALLLWAATHETSARAAASQAAGAAAPAAVRAGTQAGEDTRTQLDDRVGTRAPGRMFAPSLGTRTGAPGAFPNSRTADEFGRDQPFATRGTAQEADAAGRRGTSMDPAALFGADSRDLGAPSRARTDRAPRPIDRK